VTNFPFRDVLGCEQCDLNAPEDHVAKWEQSRKNCEATFPASLKVLRFEI
jgi:hypothetical protein